MKLFRFEPNSYGDYYIVQSETPTCALLTLQVYMMNTNHLHREWERWRSATIDNLPDKFTIEQIKGDVVEANYH